MLPVVQSVVQASCTHTPACARPATLRAAVTAAAAHGRSCGGLPRDHTYTGASKLPNEACSMHLADTESTEEVSASTTHVQIAHTRKHH